MKLSKILNEIIQHFNEADSSESPAAREARSKGLTHVRYGMYADRTGNIVARTEHGKLVPVKGDSPQSAAPSSQKPQFGSPRSRKREPDIPHPRLNSQGIAMSVSNYATSTEPNAQQQMPNTSYQMHKNRYRESDFYTNPYSHLHNEFFDELPTVETAEDVAEILKTAMESDIRKINLNSDVIRQYQNKLDAVERAGGRRGEIHGCISWHTREMYLSDKISANLGNIKQMFTKENISKYLTRGEASYRTQEELDAAEQMREGVGALHTVIHELVHSKSRKESHHMLSSGLFIEEGLTELKARQLTEQMIVGPDKKLTEYTKYSKFIAYELAVRNLQKLQDLSPNITDHLWRMTNDQARQELISTTVKAFMDKSMVAAGMSSQKRDEVHKFMVKIGNTYNAVRYNQQMSNLEKFNSYASHMENPDFIQMMDTFKTASARHIWEYYQDMRAEYQKED